MINVFTLRYTLNVRYKRGTQNINNVTSEDNGTLSMTKGINVDIFRAKNNKNVFSTKAYYRFENGIHSVSQ